MEVSNAKLWIKTLAILNWVSAGLGIIVGVIFLFSSAFSAEIVSLLVAEGEIALDPAMVLDTQTALTVFFFSVGVILIVLSILGIFVGFGLWRYRNWARILTLISLWIGVVWMIVNMIMAFFSGIIAIIINAGFFLVGMVISGFFLWLFHVEPNTKALFTLSPPSKPSEKSISKKRVVSKTTKRGK